MSKIGYIRVSTEHQETARQQEIMGNLNTQRAATSVKQHIVPSDRDLETQSPFFLSLITASLLKFHSRTWVVL